MLIMKILSILTAILMFLLTAGCSGKPQKPSPDSTLPTKDTELTEPSEELPTDGLTPIYDNTAVLEAYRSGDTSGLDDKQLVVLNGAKEAIGEFYTEDMTPEEIIIAAHDWLVTTTVYDEQMMLPVPVRTPDTENPYGVFTLHQAICMGYTTTFQLFMDILGVESMIVRGNALEEEHAWNMVCLDGEWYHVDCTWDDFVPDDEGRPPFHTYTLVPDYVMDVQHIWDHDSAPSATAEDRIYFKTHGTYAATAEECSALLIQANSEKQRYSELMLDSVDYITFDCTEQYWVHDFGKYAVITYWMQ